MYIEVLRVCVCISDSVPLEKDDDDVDDDDDAIYCITHVQTCVVCVSIQHISYTMKINWFFVCALKTQRNENQLNKAEQTHIQAHTHVHFFPSIFLCTVYEHTHTCMYIHCTSIYIYI